MITAAKIIGVLEYAEALAMRYGFDGALPHINTATRAVIAEVRKRNRRAAKAKEPKR